MAENDLDAKLVRSAQRDLRDAIISAYKAALRAESRMAYSATVGDTDFYRTRFSTPLHDLYKQASAGF